MSIRDAVSVKVADPSGGTAVETNVFTTPQSLVTFSGATGAAIAVSSVIIAFAPDLADDIVKAVASLFIGLVVYLIGFDPNLELRDQAVALCIAAINTCVIAAAVLGVSPSTGG